MFASTLVVMAVVALGLASDPVPVSYIPPYNPVLPKYIPVELVAGPLVDKLNGLIDNLESRETAQLSQLRRANAEADQNVEFMNRFNQIIQQNLDFKQKTQDSRLDALEESIAKIKVLRKKVQILQNDATAINDNINNDVYPSRKQIKYDIDDLQNVAIEFNSKLTETQQRADDVASRIDSLAEKSWDNTRDLLYLDAARKRVTFEVNYQQVVAVSSDEVYPGSAVTVPYNTTFWGAPRFNQISIVGFNLQKNTNPYYNVGYPSLYFGLDATYETNQTIVAAVDMSTGGWKANYVVSSYGGIYFSGTVPVTL